MIAPPRWTDAQLQQDLNQATDIFRRERLLEPLEAYVDAFDRYQGFVEDLLETSTDLTELESTALDILTDRHLLETFRYLAGPPLSADDLKTLSDAVLSPKRLATAPEMVRRIVEVVKTSLDRRRFPWVSEDREPTEEEKTAAVLASAALMAASRVGTSRRAEGKEAQELLVETALLHAGLNKVPVRSMPTLNHAPGPGEFCRESLLGPRKADLIVGLWDQRVMAIECKVSNSAVNSVKRLNNDAAAKAETWLRDFGRIQVVPTAVLSGVYKLHNLINAQERGLTLFWAHNLNPLVAWIAQTRS